MLDPKVKAMPAHQKANLAAAEEAAANGAVALYKPPMAGVGAPAAGTMDKSNPLAGLSASQGHQLAIRKGPSMPKPTWHAPWSLFRVLSLSLGTSGLQPERQTGGSRSGTWPAASSRSPSPGTSLL